MPRVLLVFKSPISGQIKITSVKGRIMGFQQIAKESLAKERAAATCALYSTETKVRAVTFRTKVDMNKSNDKCEGVWRLKLPEILWKLSAC